MLDCLGPESSCYQSEISGQDVFEYKTSSHVQRESWRCLFATSISFALRQIQATSLAHADPRYSFLLSGVIPAELEGMSLVPRLDQVAGEADSRLGCNNLLRA